MELILLSGNSARTKDWIEEAEKKFREDFGSTYIQYYDHWKEGQKMMNIDHELDGLSEYLKDKEDYIIFAKSLGTVIALKGIYESKISPERCMFLGLPVNVCKELNVPIKKYLEGYKIPTYFIQKAKDPAIHAEELKEILEEMKVNDYKFMEVPGEDHHYENLDQIKQVLKELRS